MAMIKIIAVFVAASFLAASASDTVAESVSPKSSQTAGHATVHTNTAHMSSAQVKTGGGVKPKVGTVTTFLTATECTKLGGDVVSNDTCTGGKMCRTQTVSPVTNEVTTHTLCLTS
jgi:hypothetical protein